MAAEKCTPRGHFKKVYELLNLRAPKIPILCKNCIFQCMGKIFCVEFQSALWNSTQNIWPIHWKMCIIFTGEKITACKCLWNAPLILTSQITSNISPLWVNCGVSILNFLEKNDHVMTSSNNTLKPQKPTHTLPYNWPNLSLQQTCYTGIFISYYKQKAREYLINNRNDEQLVKLLLKIDLYFNHKLIKLVNGYVVHL